MQLSQIRLPLDNFDACRDFYRDLLGFKMTLETEDSTYAQFFKKGRCAWNLPAGFNVQCRWQGAGFC